MKRLYILDTNCVSELFKLQPDSNFLMNFIKNEKRCCISSTTWNELIYGAYIMPEGKRREFIISKIFNEIQSVFPVVNLDAHAALIQGDLRARLKNKGKIIDYDDTEIASVAIANQMILVTRNTKHFDCIKEVNSVFYMENWFE